MGISHNNAYSYFSLNANDDKKDFDRNSYYNRLKKIIDLKKSNESLEKNITTLQDYYFDLNELFHRSFLKQDENEKYERYNREENIFLYQYMLSLLPESEHLETTLIVNSINKYLPGLNYCRPNQKEHDYNYFLFLLLFGHEFNLKRVKATRIYGGAIKEENNNITFSVRKEISGTTVAEIEIVDTASIKYIASGL